MTCYRKHSHTHYDTNHRHLTADIRDSTAKKVERTRRLLSHYHASNTQNFSWR